MPERIKKRLGELLIEAGAVTKEDLQRVLERKGDGGKRLGELLVAERLCTEQHIARALSSQLGLEFVNLRMAPIEPEAVARIPEDLARKHLIMPINLTGTSLSLAMADPLNLEAVDDVRFASGLNPKVHITTRSDVLWAIGQHYELDTALDEITADFGSAPVVETVFDAGDEQADIHDLEKRSRAAPTIRMVNSILSSAVETRASDIHVEPERDRLTIRYRVDGFLRQHLELPKWVQGAAISRIKVIAQMDIAEKRLPQDGRVKLNVGGRVVDLRVSSLPTHHGEKIVIRLLDPDSSPSSLEKIGLEGEDLDHLLSLLSQSQGIIMVTGPTGSGKTTTLYAGLSHVRNVTKNIITVEDPIEYELPGINQVSVNERAGRTFASVLPSILRQDPDIIMVGEMRDFDTATIAMQASLTGHLVLSTIHTNNSVATVTRLRNLGIPSYLIASTIEGIVAQRLVRTICPDCKVSDPPGEEGLRQIGLSPARAANLNFFRGKGCRACNGSGYTGRTGIYELLVLSQGIKELISNEATESAISQLALAEGMTPLASAGIAKAAAGITSLDEIIRVTRMESNKDSATCPECGQGVGSGFVVCSQCGFRLTNACPSCTQIVDASWTFCPYCAVSLVEQDTRPTLKVSTAS